MSAPPDESAVNRKIKIVLNELTNETPETLASLEKLTTKVSAIFTNINRNYSIKSGIIKFLKSLLVNIVCLIFPTKVLLIFCKHFFNLVHIPVTKTSGNH